MANGELRGQAGRAEADPFYLGLYSASSLCLAVADEGSVIVLFPITNHAFAVTPKEGPCRHGAQCPFAPSHDPFGFAEPSESYVFVGHKSIIESLALPPYNS